MPVRSALLWSGVVVAVALAAIGLLGMWRASRAADAGKAQLLLAEKDLLAQRVEPARQDLVLAQRDFRQMQFELHGFGIRQALAVWQLVPLVRVQVRAANTFADVGVSLSQAGLQITDAVDAIERPADQAVPLSDSIDKLRTVRGFLHGGVKALDDATTRLRSINRYRLFGPLDHAQHAVANRLVHIDASAKSAEQGLTALIAFAGGNGPRQYLILSQNPDEVRPTGGFEGSYGVLTANGGKVYLERYDDSTLWIADHPTAVVPADQANSPFRLYDPPLGQTLADVNAVPDWPHVAQVSLKLWQQGGEQPVNGVVSFTPEMLARVLAVTGPVTVASYGETVTSANVIDRIEYYTHVLTPPAGTNRKDFLAPLGQAVLAKLLTTPAAQWRALGSAVYQAFSARELLVWSSDSAVQNTVVSRGWDGVLPGGDGDFFFDGEVEYAAKNGRGLKRTFEHDVALNADGSARVTTTMTINNTEGPSVRANNNVLTYFTMYGPPGAVLDPSSDPAFTSEPSVAGHPAWGWFRTVLPNDRATITVVWDVPAASQLLTNGAWQYPLRFLHIVDNSADVLHLTVHLPPRGRWVGTPPPSQSRLDHDIEGIWSYRIAH